jgi:hypothetical protein
VCRARPGEGKARLEADLLKAEQQVAKLKADLDAAKEAPKRLKKFRVRIGV